MFKCTTFTLGEFKLKNRSGMKYFLLVVLQLTWLPSTQGHGRLIDPPSRSSMWRYGFRTPHNYNDNQLYCGGVHVQYEQNGGKCGVCGDPYNGPRDNEPPGKYANGIIVRKYSMGQVMTVVVELTANHKGWMEFKICPGDDKRRVVTQACLDKYTLPLATTKKTRYYVPNKNGHQIIRLDLQLPSNVKCKSCLFQWKYNAGNSWGTDPKTGRGCVGCGNQEQFYGCSDIAIGYDDIEIPEHNVLPADTDFEDKDLVEATAPPDTEWHWTARPGNRENERSEMEKQTDSDKKSTSFSFVPVMNTNGMNPCMCICKRPPLKLQGGENKNLEAKFFDNIDGLDSQVCMCMCQSRATSVVTCPLLYICALLLYVLNNFLFRRQ